MAVIISSTFLYSPTISSSSHRTATFGNHLFNYNYTRRSYNNSQSYTGLLLTCKATDNNSESTEESRWLREEQRWLREEQRWLREEARWNTERTSLLLQIQHLQSELDRIRAIRSDSVNLDVDYVVNDDNDESSASKLLVKMAALLKGLGSDVDSESKRIAEITDKSMKSVESKKSEVDAPVRFDSVVVPVSPSEGQPKDKDMDKNKDKERETKKEKRKSTPSLRMGAEGEEVRVLQEALMSLGFYSGEEDMEFSSFSDGTARAVKTWQASIGIREDGIMTAELLERLYASGEVQTSETSLTADIKKIDEANGAVSKVREVPQTTVKKEQTYVDETRPRVFLLGENRWEEPSRLNKTTGNTQVSAGRCLTCKGEGRLLCMECDGTGEPNIEEQFLDWVDEEAKCPYCEGLGYNVCDVCEGKPVL